MRLVSSGCTKHNEKTQSILERNQKSAEDTTPFKEEEMIVNHNYKFMAFMEPHTGSRSLSEMLLLIDGSKKVGHHHMDLAYGLERDLLPKDGYLMFCVARDPRDILATQIVTNVHNPFISRQIAKGKLSKEGITEEFVKKACEKDLFFRHVHYVDYIIRYERLQNSLDKLLKWLGVKEPPELLRATKTITKNKKQWFTYFTSEQLVRMYRMIPEIKQFREWQ